MSKTEERQRFVTLKKLGEEYWIVEAEGNQYQTNILERVKFLPQGIQGYVKIGKQVGKKLDLPFLKRNQTPLKQASKERSRGKKLEQKQKRIKTNWLEWSANYSEEQQAIIEGISTAEKLMRDLAKDVNKNLEYHYNFTSLETDKNLSRFAQLCELKTLWLKRNIKSITKLEKAQHQPKFYYFEEYFDFDFKYKYYVDFLEKKYVLFSDRKLKSVDCSGSFTYPKSVDKTKLSPAPKIPLDQFVPAIEYGARSFWQKYWSKEKNQLIFND